MENIHAQIMTLGAISLIAYLLHLFLIPFVVVLSLVFLSNLIPSFFSYEKYFDDSSFKFMYVFVSSVIGFVIAFTLLGYLVIFFNADDIIGIVLLDYNIIPLPDLKAVENIQLLYIFICLFASGLLYNTIILLITPIYSEFATLIDPPNTTIASANVTSFTFIGLIFLTVGILGEIFFYNIPVISTNYFFILGIVGIVLVIFILIKMHNHKILTQIKQLYCGTINDTHLCFYNTPCIFIGNEKICLNEKDKQYLNLE